MLDVETTSQIIQDKWKKMRDSLVQIIIYYYIRICRDALVLFLFFR